MAFCSEVFPTGPFAYGSIPFASFAQLHVWYWPFVAQQGCTPLVLCHLSQHSTTTALSSGGIIVYKCCRMGEQTHVGAYIPVVVSPVAYFVLHHRCESQNATVRVGHKSSMYSVAHYRGRRQLLWIVLRARLLIALASPSLRHGVAQLCREGIKTLT